MRNPMGPRLGHAFRVKNPIKTRKYKFDQNAVIDVTILPGTIGLFWDQKTDDGSWNASFYKLADIETEGYGVLTMTNLDDIEFLRQDEYRPEWGKPPDNLPLDAKAPALKSP